MVSRMARFRRNMATVCLLGVSISTGASAQTYQIDCAILLCLSGGWPASAPCNAARAEFIRRVTPWPVEPPLQIWRCPMSTSSVLELEGGTEPHRVLASSPEQDEWSTFEATIRSSNTPPELLTITSSPGFLREVASEQLEQVQARADIDISGPEFDFVRSIRVFHVARAYRREEGPAGGEQCERSISIRLGTYDTQGGFFWEQAELSQLPVNHAGLESWHSGCADLYHRSVFLDWQSFQGGYGYEQINY